MGKGLGTRVLGLGRGFREETGNGGESEMGREFKVETLTQLLATPVNILSRFSYPSSLTEPSFTLALAARALSLTVAKIFSA